MTTIFWIGCALAALASLAAWIADHGVTPADKPEDARFLEIKAAMARWEEDCKPARIGSGYAGLERESDAASDRLWEVVRPRTATRP
jgi:hypothetical protein